MDTVAVQRLGDDLSEYVADVFASLRYAGWQDRAGHYLRGLMLDGRRKSIQPMAARLHGPHEQALNHFVTNSPWDVTPVRRRLAERISQARHRRRQQSRPPSESGIALRRAASR